MAHANMGYSFGLSKLIISEIVLLRLINKVQEVSDSEYFDAPIIADRK